MLEVEDVPQIRAAPLVDRLIRIAHDAEVPVTRREAVNHQVLRTVRVLILVDHQVLELLAVSFPYQLGFLEQLHRSQQQVVEIEGVGILQCLNVGRIQLSDLTDRAGSTSWR